MLNAEIEEQSIAQRSIKSAAWLFGRRISISLIRLAAVAILARHLSPADFGLVALAQVLLQFIVLTSVTGIGTYVIYDRAAGWEDRTHSAFWLNFSITLAQLILCAVGIYVVTYFYPQNELRAILAALAVVFFMRQMVVIPEALLQRSLKYEPLVARDTVFDILSAGLSVALAIKGWGLWSLVMPQVVLEPFRLVAIFSVAKWLPNFRLGLKDWPRIGWYAGHSIGTNFLNLIANDGDTLLVGKILGSQPLGYYNLAWQFSNLIGRNVTAVISSVAMPALSMLKKNELQLQDAYRRMLRLLAAISFPALCGIFAIAGDLVQIIYGPKWEPIVILLRIFIVFTMVRSVTSPSGVIYNVVGRPDIGFKFTVVFLPFYLGAIYIGSQYGIVGVAVGVTIVRTVGGLIAFALSERLIHMPFLRGIAVMLRAGVLSIAMGGFVWAADAVLAGLGIELLLRTIFCVVFGALIYIIGLAIFERETYLEVTNLTSSLIPAPIRAKLGQLANWSTFTDVKNL